MKLSDECSLFADLNRSVEIIQFTCLKFYTIRSNATWIILENLDWFAVMLHWVRDQFV